ncbi:MAG: hypothetical protein NC420_04655 [Eubacterium sp.]|nr:hypothetical protein [Eubacterium sp.]
MAFSDKIMRFEGQNPFSDSQARNFSDTKILGEFFPISLFWTLFNDQHEILLGARGSGKTFLLKMMRYSMLKRIKDKRAQSIIKNKTYIAMYVPMHLEFVTPINNTLLEEPKQIELFQVSFNCFLAKALLVEIESILDENENVEERMKKQILLISDIEYAWFGEHTGICDFIDLATKIEHAFYKIDWKTGEVEHIPPVFKRQICTPLIAVKDIICHRLELVNDPTWIICVDEAEFLNPVLQKCINSVFRSDSNRIALKVATLPFYHTTLETLEEGIMVSDINDFTYRVVDMQCESMDFVNLTNSLCEHRLYERFNNKERCKSVEEFLGTIGNDDYIDYYRLEVGEDASKRETIEKKIIEEFPPKRKENAPQYSNKRKTVFDKYAPIYYIRKMRKLSKTGNHKPGWYAGAKTIRKASQGNPRLFIQIMGQLFDKARESTLSVKVQHEIIYKYCCELCESTRALEVEGPLAYKKLKMISEKLMDKIHGQYLVSGGYSFLIHYKDEADFLNNQRWIELAIAYSRIHVDDEVKKGGLKTETRYCVANAYAIAYWIPMRSDNTLDIYLDEKITNSYEIKKRKKKSDEDGYIQLSLFGEDGLPV